MATPQTARQAGRGLQALRMPPGLEKAAASCPVLPTLLAHEQATGAAEAGQTPHLQFKLPREKDSHVLVKIQILKTVQKEPEFLYESLLVKSFK